MKYEYKIIYDTYDHFTGKFIIQVELGDSKLFDENDRFNIIIDEADGYLTKIEWKSIHNKFVIYDKRPKGDGYNIVYSLSFKDDNHKDYFLYMLDKYYNDLNYHESIYSINPCIKIGSDSDR